MGSGQFSYFFEPMPFFRRVLLSMGLGVSLWGLAIAPRSPAFPNPDNAADNANLLKETSDPPETPTNDLDLEPTIIENSPVLQRWLEEVPDVLSDIEREPSFRSRLRAGYQQNWSDGDGGIVVGVEDIFLGSTGLTVSGDYQTEFGDRDRDHQDQYGIDLRYYLLPLGQQVNIAPVLGYRQVALRGDVGRDEIDGANVGIRLLLVPGRTGAADLSLTQTWVDPGGDRPLSRFNLSVGYALTQEVRLSTDIQVQTSERHNQTAVGLVLEWLL